MDVYTLSRVALMDGYRGERGVKVRRRVVRSVFVNKEALIDAWESIHKQINTSLGL